MTFGKIFVVPPLSDVYRVNQDQLEHLITPALLIYPRIVESNIQATLQLAGGDPNRWRPHLKTSKIPAVIRFLIAAGVQNFKCSTTLELLTASELWRKDILLAFSAVGANARRVVQIAKMFPNTRISVLVESADQLPAWRGTDIGVFLDINSGMNRTGVNQAGIEEITDLSKRAGSQFRGLHYYDGHMSGVPASEREARAHDGYRQVVEIVEALSRAQINVEEVITSGTPAAPYALSFLPFHHASFVHRISPGTVVYNDMTSLEQLPGLGYQPAALVLSSVVSHPTAEVVTCDAGHKSVSADAGVPTCTVLEHEEFKPLKPSEEHLPINCDEAPACPKIGDKLYLLPRHVCPTVNNFDEALFIVDGQVSSVESVTARGHERPMLRDESSPSMVTSSR